MPVEMWLERVRLIGSGIWVVGHHVIRLPGEGGRIVIRGIEEIDVGAVAIDAWLPASAHAAQTLDCSPTGSLTMPLA